MSQIIQIASHGLSLVALCDDGKLWRQFQDGSGWTLVDVPAAMMPNQREPGAMPFTIMDSAAIAGERDAIADCQPIDDEQKPEPPCNGEIPSQYTPAEWPEGAEWWAVDDCQIAWFYSNEPELDGQNWFGSRAGVYDSGYDKHYQPNTIPDHSTSKRRKPQPSTTEAEIV